MNMMHGILKGKQDSREQMLKETLLIAEQKFPIKYKTEIRTKLIHWTESSAKVCIRLGQDEEDVSFKGDTNCYACFHRCSFIFHKLVKLNKKKRTLQKYTCFSVCGIK